MISNEILSFKTACFIHIITIHAIHLITTIFWNSHHRYTRYWLNWCLHSWDWIIHFQIDTVYACWMCGYWTSSLDDFCLLSLMGQTISTSSSKWALTWGIQYSMSNVWSKNIPTRQTSFEALDSKGYSL